MKNPVRAPRKPVGIEISDEQRRLEKDEAGNPHRCRPAKHRKQLLGGYRLNKEEQKRGEKNSTAKEDSKPGHAQPHASRNKTGPALILLRQSQHEQLCQMGTAAGRISSTSTHCGG